MDRGQVPDATGKKLLDLKVRPLLVDTRIKEYTTGNPHELTDRLFVVRRAFRVNDALPADNATRWQSARRLAAGGSRHRTSLAAQSA